MCAAWFPCDANGWHIEPFVAVPVLLVVLIVIVFLAIKSVIDKDTCQGNTVLYLIMASSTSVAFISLITSSEFIYWATITGVDHEYISFQGCVAACNSMAFPPDVVLDRFCGDKNANRWAIWEEDTNPILSLRSSSSCPSHYCSQCGSKVDDLAKMLDLAWFLRVRSYAFLFFVYVFVYFSSSSRPVQLITTAALCVLWVSAAVLLSRVADLLGARNQLNAYSGMDEKVSPLYLFDAGCACVGVDVFLFCFLLFYIPCRTDATKITMKTGARMPDTLYARIQLR